ncbi:MAG TPA: PRC-barrel domain-containing protein [Candidatus Saccharimonadales bacterium]|nr:PRC-barrel domain-containing protein [Candidatus Saccharimonadales bacterium]
MRLDLGSPVRCTDDAVGELADVVIDPQTRRVTHLVVQPHHRDEEARLVPIDRAQAGEASDATISLNCTVAQMSEFELVREAAYLRLGEVPAEDPDWDVGIEEPLGLPPSPGMDAYGVGGVDIDPHVMLTYDRVPMGEVEIRRASSVTSADGHHLGHVDGFVLDSEQQIAHLVLEHGHLWGRREVVIPASAVARVETDEVTLTLSKEEVGALPSARVHRRD